MNPARRSSRRSSRRGFSLIELGIVIAVISVLAAVVIFGRGFILAARVTKAVDASNTLRKAASTFGGLNGGSLQAFSNTSQLTALSDRALIPPLAGQTVWTVSGAAGSNDAVAVTDVRFGQTQGAAGAGNAIAIRITAPTAAMAQDILRAVTDDKNLITTGPTVGLVCANPTVPVTAPSVVLCFFL